MKRILLSFIFLLALVVGALDLSGSGETVHLIDIDDQIINPVSSEYIMGAIEKAETDGAKLLIIKLNTPGGLVTSTRKIVQKMMSSKVPIAVYVAPKGARAGSAGVFITLAANIAAMAPSTNIGAAHPVSLGGKRSIGNKFGDLLDKIKDAKKEKGETSEKKEPMDDKILNDTKAWAQGIAKERGRNVKWAIQSVTESVSITSDEAKKRGVIDFVASDVQELLGMIDLKLADATVVTIPMTTRQKVLMVLASPNLAYILLMLGFYGLLFEFTHPGIGFPGVAGAISLVVGFYGLHILAANYAGIFLIVLAIILFVMEVKIVSYGLLTLGGLVSIVIGSLMLFDSPDEFMRVSLPLIFAFSFATFVIALFLVTTLVRSHRRKVATGKEGLLGMEAEVLKWRFGKGKVFLHGEIWDASGEGEYKKGENVVVVDVKGMKVVVESK